MDRTPGGFGGKLREARERRGITLKQIANATKISTSALEALERNDLSRLPGGIFSRAFVRSYAIEVGLDPDETTREFIAQAPHDAVAAGHPMSGQAEDNESIESDRRMASVFVRLVLLSVPVAGAVLYFSLAGRQAALPAGAASPVEAGPTLAAPPVLEPAASNRAGGLAVALFATAPCWVSATVDGRTIIGRELQAGEREQFDVQRELILSAGDAGALSITLNGAGTKAFGRSGEVITRRIDLTNFKEYLTSP